MTAIDNLNDFHGLAPFPCGHGVGTTLDQSHSDYRATYTS